MVQQNNNDGFLIPRKKKLGSTMPYIDYINRVLVTAPLTWMSVGSMFVFGAKTPEGRAVTYC